MTTVWLELAARTYPHLVRREQVSKNFGLVGGWLRCQLLVHPNGDPTGVTCSRVEPTA